MEFTNAWGKLGSMTPPPTDSLTGRVKRRASNESVGSAGSVQLRRHSETTETLNTSPRDPDSPSDRWWGGKVGRMVLRFFYQFSFVGGGRRLGGQFFGWNFAGFFGLRGKEMDCGEGWRREGFLKATVVTSLVLLEFLFFGEHSIIFFLGSSISKRQRVVRKSERCDMEKRAYDILWPGTYSQHFFGYWYWG